MQPELQENAFKIRLEDIALVSSGEQVAIEL